MTGNLGKVLQESVDLCMSFIRSFCIENSKVRPYDSLGLLESQEFLENNTLHVHLSESATKKDGPSAGITLCAAIFSYLFKQPID